MPQVIHHQAGPLPITMKIDWPSNAPVVVAVSGSAWTPSPNTMLQVKVSIHSTWVGSLQHFANPAGTHLAFPDGLFVVDGDFGETSITLTAGNGATVTDPNDLFTVAVIY